MKTEETPNVVCSYQDINQLVDSTERRGGEVVCFGWLVCFIPSDNDYVLVRRSLYVTCFVVTL